LILKIEACDLLTQYDKGALCAVPTIYPHHDLVVGTLRFAHPTKLPVGKTFGEIPK
jgi:hypothetical protein